MTTFIQDYYLFFMVVLLSLSILILLRSIIGLVVQVIYFAVAVFISLSNLVLLFIVVFLSLSFIFFFLLILVLFVQVIFFAVAVFISLSNIVWLVNVLFAIQIIFALFLIYRIKAAIDYDTQLHLEKTHLTERYYTK